MLDREDAERLRRSPKRASFFCAALSSLAAELRSRGSGLVIRRGSLRQTVTRLAREAQVDAVVWSWGYDGSLVERHRELQRAVEEAGLRAVLLHDAPALSPEDAKPARAEGDGYRAFAPYLAAWRQHAPSVVVSRLTFANSVPPSEAIPIPAEFGSAAEQALKPAVATASEDAAAHVLAAFLRGPALAYATHRNVPALATSRLSAHLSFGTISARTILAAVAERAADPFLLAEERLSLDRFVAALARRDFFFQLAWFYPHSAREPLQERMRAFRFARSHRALEAWRRGMTGYPLVDAGIRELIATGTMHPRARAVAASFLCFDLGVEWRTGQDVWDHLLVEDDPALATGNWQWIAGVGADLAQYPRIYNPRKQARRLDPSGTYIRHWIPELASLPPAELFEPDRAQQRAQLALPLGGTLQYPPPIIDHDAVARQFLARYSEFTRRSAGRWASADRASR